MKIVTLLPISDYFKSRKKLYYKFIIPIILSLSVLIFSFIYNVREDINISDFFSEFVSIQISAVAILISFSVAIITILVTCDGNNIKKLKNTEAEEFNYKPVKGKVLSLFQILLSNVTYNVFTEVIFLIILIGEIFLRLVLPVFMFKYLTALDVFFIIHILSVLLESVTQMYLTFWKDNE